MCTIWAGRDVIDQVRIQPPAIAADVAESARLLDALKM
jgi:hypothetical protein